jgi:fluoride exporter
LRRLHHLQLFQPDLLCRSAARSPRGPLVEYRAIAHPLPDQRLGRSYRRCAVPSRFSCSVACSAQINPLTIMLLAIVLVFFGGAVGSMWRYWWSGLIAQRFGETFPFGTLAVNIVGSILIGTFAGLVTHVSNGIIAAALLQFLVVGICGGLTTFSSFSLQTYSLITEGRWLSALSNIIFSTGLSFGGVAFGWQITQGVNS